MTIELQVANLVTATTALTTAVNVSKATLDQRVTDATTQAGLAATRATQAATSVTTAGTSANQAAGSASQALAIFSTTAAMNAALATAASQSSAAQTAASSASSVLQQDLSAISAALHRSPAAVTAMTIYDTSKDSDGGAWVDRMHDKSWANEPLNGAWLTGGFATELLSRGDNLISHSEELDHASWTKVNISVTPNLAVTAEGSTTLDMLTYNGTAGGQRIHKVATVAAGAVVSVSAVFKAGTANGSLSSSDGGGGGVVYVKADLIAGTISASLGSPTSPSIVALGGGTFRVSFTRVALANMSVEVGVWDGAADMFGYPQATNGKTVFAGQVKANQVGVLPSTYSASPELVSNGGFDNGTAGWAAGNSASLSIVSGTLRVTNTAALNGQASQSFTTVIGKVYRAYAEQIAGTSGVWYLQVGNSALSGALGSTAPASSATSASFSFVATATTTFVSVWTSATSGQYSDFDNISVKEVTTLATPYVPYSTQTNSYYQSSADGKFYRLGATFAALTEVFRGNKAKFPRLAAIVAENGSVTIYDLTEPGRPMFARWTITGIAGIGTITSLTASQGQIIAGSTSGVFFFDHAKDIGRFLQSANDSSFRLIPRPIVSAGITAGLSSNRVISNTINAVAITVLPDAPIDVVTGLPVPTIAVATAGGVSVIRHDGTVINDTSLVGSVICQTIGFTADQRLIRNWNDGNRLGIFNGTSKIPVASFSTAASYDFYFNIPAGGSAPLLPVSAGQLQPTQGKTIALYGAGGINLIKQHVQDRTRSLIAGIASTHNTGWMIGDIRRAYMADTVVGNLTATELVTNGSNETALFAMGTLGFANVAASRVASPSGAGFVALAQNNSAVSSSHQINSANAFIPANTAVEITMRVYVPTGGVAVMRLLDNSDGSWPGPNTTLKDQWVTLTAIRPAKATAWILGLGNNSLEAITNGAPAFYVDDITVKEASPDRSYKAAAANINGTIVKSAVASAAQLVTFSGWSALNYLQEPYSADLDYGVGDFRLSAWVNYLPTRVNLLVKTEDMTDVAWAKAAVTASAGANSLIVENATTGEHFIDQTIPTVVGTGTATWRLQAAGRTKGAVAIVHVGDVGTVSALNFDLTTKTITASGGLISAATITDLLDGTFRLTATYAVTAACTSLRHRLLLGNATGLTSYTGDGVSGMYLREPQMQAGSIATTYQRVNTATDYTGYNATIAERSAASGPSLRLGIQGDRLIATVFDGTTTRTVTSTDSYATGVVAKTSVNYSSGRLAINVNGLEVASTNGAPLLTMNTGLPRHNLLTKTEQFDDVAWGKIITTVTANTTTAPDGTSTADTFTFSASASSQVIQNVSPVAGSHVLSARVKVASGTKQFRLKYYNGTVDAYSIDFTATTDWQTFLLVFTGVSAAGNVAIVNGSAGAAGDLQAWGAQLETGSTATAYQRVNTVSDYDLTVAIRASLTIGNSRALDAPFPGSISLVKTGVTIPTPEQAWWMFDQERRMFQSGAQITLPASTAVSDLVYDDQQDKWVASQPTFESSFTGLIRTASAAPSAGTFNKVSATNGVKLSSRATTLPGVDVTVPPYGLREELVRRAEAAAKATRPITALNRDAIGFTATTTNASSALTAVSVTSGVPYIGMVVSGTGIPAGTRIIGINGTIYYLNANATATATAVAIGQTSFTLPVGFTAVEVMTAGNSRQEGATKDYVRNFDGFAETVQFAVSPGSGAWCQFIVRKEIV